MICLGVILIVNLFIQPFSCLCDRLNYGVQIVLDARHIQRVPVIAMLFDLLRKTGCCGTNLKRNFNDCIHAQPRHGGYFTHSNARSTCATQPYGSRSHCWLLYLSTRQPIAAAAFNFSLSLSRLWRPPANTH